MCSTRGLVALAVLCVRTPRGSDVSLGSVAPRRTAPRKALRKSQNSPRPPGTWPRRIPSMTGERRGRTGCCCCAVRSVLNSWGNMCSGDEEAILNLVMLLLAEQNHGEPCRRARTPPANEACGRGVFHQRPAKVSPRWPERHGSVRVSSRDARS